MLNCSWSVRGKVIVVSALLSAVGCDFLPRGTQLGDGSTIHHYFGTRFRSGGYFEGGAPVMSPDGQTVIYAAPVDGNAGDIIRVRVDGTARMRLTADATFDGDPYISSDGDTIAFTSEQTGPPKIFLMGANGLNRRQITRGEFPDFYPLISPDGLTVAFTRQLSTSANAARSREIFIVSVNGDGERQITTNHVADYPVAFSSNSQSLYYLAGTTQYDLHLVDIASQKSSRVLRRGLKGYSCDISPDGTTIAFVADYGTPFEYDVYLSLMDGSNRRRLTSLRGYIDRVRFCPDGKSVIFVAEPKGAPNRGRGTICTVKLDGACFRKIARNE